ncbi:hypothetical protein N9O56_03365, partial [Rickettsiales bacterium]|nr:hypothetical protein [Rickettsiales bacterium]
MFRRSSKKKVVTARKSKKPSDSDKSLSEITQSLSEITQSLSEITQSLAEIEGQLKKLESLKELCEESLTKLGQGSAIENQKIETLVRSLFSNKEIGRIVSQQSHGGNEHKYTTSDLNNIKGSLVSTKINSLKKTKEELTRLIEQKTAEQKAQDEEREAAREKAAQQNGLISEDMGGNDEEVARPDFLSSLPREHPDQRLIQENGTLRLKIKELTNRLLKKEKNLKTAKQEKDELTQKVLPLEAKIRELEDQQSEVNRLAHENAELDRKLRELQNQQESQSQQQRRSASTASSENSEEEQRLAAQLQEMENKLVVQKTSFESKARELKEIENHLAKFYRAIEVLPGEVRDADRLSNKISELIRFKEGLGKEVEELRAKKQQFEQDLIALKEQVATASSSLSDIERTTSSLQTYDSATLKNIVDREARLEIGEQELQKNAAMLEGFLEEFNKREEEFERRKELDLSLNPLRSFINSLDEEVDSEELFQIFVETLEKKRCLEEENKELKEEIDSVLRNGGITRAYISSYVDNLRSAHGVYRSGPVIERIQELLSPLITYYEEQTKARQERLDDKIKKVDES